MVFSTAEMMRIYEEKEEAREKSNHNLGKTERIISEFEDVKVKMKAIEREKISLQETVSTHSVMERYKLVLLYCTHLSVNKPSFQNIATNLF